jgi:hypothetical protein
MTWKEKLMRKIILIYAAVSLSAFCQDAKVVQLDPKDSQRIKELFEAKQAADAAWEGAQTDIQNRYASKQEERAVSLYAISGSGSASVLSYRADGSAERVDPCSVYPGDAQTHAACGKKYVESLESDRKRREETKKELVYVPLPGWEQGIAFSSDFKFIIPKTAPAAALKFWSPMVAW